MSILAKSPASIKFKVYKSTPELVTPAKPTPHEFKQLSDLENLDRYRVQIPIFMVYPHIPSKKGVDHVDVIRKAIAQTLVFYYPFAGRLIECPLGKLEVECTGEGILFIEVDADVTLHQFGYPIVAPFPCLDQLLFDVPGSSRILNSPLLLIQVTRLKCGGLVLGIRFNHVICDAIGLSQFMYAVGEIARGATSPSILPIWERHIIHFPTSPQKLTSSIAESGMDLSDENLKFELESDLYSRSFFFGPTEILALKRHVPPHLRHCTSFEIVSASVWKCRIMALQPHPTKCAIFNSAINLRIKLKIPVGYYGNAAMIQVSKSTVKEIIENPLCYTLQLIQNAKDEVINIDDYARTLANMNENALSYCVSDLRQAGFEKVDFGWGEAVYGGLVHSGTIGGFHLPYKNKNGESGIMLSMCLPKQVMESFEHEINNLLKEPFSRDEYTVQSKL